MITLSEYWKEKWNKVSIAGEISLQPSFGALRTQLNMRASRSAKLFNKLERQVRMLSVITISESEKWDKIVKSFSNHDVYYLSGYSKAFQINGDGEPLLFYFDNGNTRAMNVVMKRDIAEDRNFVGKLEINKYFDLSTPYGYGGFIIEGSNISSFFKQYGQWCSDNNVVSEFIRFHPFLINTHRLIECYDIEFDRQTLGTNLKDYGDPLKFELTSGCRNVIRKAIRNGVTYKITQAPDNIDCFKKIYFETMKRNNASQYYYFSDSYFDTCLKLLQPRILLSEAYFDNRVVASGIHFICNVIIEDYLIGTLDEYLHMFPTYLIKYGVIEWGALNSYNLVHHGGGKTSSESDGLFAFKKKFSRNTKFDFYLGKKIWNPDIYEKLIGIRELSKDFLDKTDFFPKYRA